MFMLFIGDPQTPGVPGRKLVRVVAWDLGPWFTVQLCFLPAGVSKEERSHDFQSMEERF